MSGSGGMLTGLVAELFARDPDASSFKVDTADYTGIDHSAFRTKLVQLALTDPKSYFKLRQIVLDNVKKVAVSTQYKVYYNLLHDGLMADGSRVVPEGIDTLLGESLSQIFRPRVPMQECNKFALSCAKTIDKISEEAIEMIIPLNYKSIAEERTKKHTEGNLGFPTAPSVPSVPST